MSADIRVLDDPAQEAAELLAAATGHVAITGGSTPRVAYERAAALRDDWSGVDFWFTDERCVAPDHEHSNFGMAERALLSAAQGATVHRMRGELGPEDGAAAYEHELGEFGPEALDLILLGLGPDGHTASLFPGSPALGVRDRLVVATGDDLHPHPRLTFTFPKRLPNKYQVKTAPKIAADRVMPSRPSTGRP